MDANRSMIVVAVGAIVVLGVLMGLLPVLLQGVRPNSIQRLVENTQQIDVYADPLEDPGPPIAPEPRRARVPAPFYEEFTPRTLTERQWQAAVDKLEEQEAEQAAQKNRMDGWREFMDSPTGGDVRAAFELLRRGKPQDAADLLEGHLPEIGQLPLEVQQPILKAAVRLFKEGGRLDLMAQSLVVFLQNMRDQLTAGGLEGRSKASQAEMLEEVETMLTEVRSRGGAL